MIDPTERLLLDRIDRLALIRVVAIKAVNAYDADVDAHGFGRPLSDAMKELKAAIWAAS